MTKDEKDMMKLCKQTVQSALRLAYGFKPALCEITLLEAAGDRTYILARVGDREYSFKSYLVCGISSVWVTEDSIKMTAKFKWSPIDGEKRIPIYE